MVINMPKDAEDDDDWLNGGVAQTTFMMRFAVLIMSSLFIMISGESWEMVPGLGLGRKSS